MGKSRYLLIFMLLQLLLLGWFMWDPFYGDAISTVSRAAWQIYEQNLATVWYLPQHDPGHPTLVPYLLALLWKVFGVSLPVAHALIAAFSLLLIYQLDRLSALFIKEENRWLVLLLLFCNAGYLAQSAQVLTHLPLAGFFVMALRALLQNKKMLFWLASMVMVMIHLEAVFILAGLGIGHLLLQRKELNNKLTFIQLVSWYLPSLALILLWGLLHHQHTGWYYSSPNYSEHRTWAGVVPMLKSFLLIAWRLLDFGNIGLYILLGWAAWKKKLPRDLSVFLIGAFVITSILMAVFMSKSIAHRYFLPFHLPVMVLVVYAYEQIQRPSKKWMMIVIILISISGSFWVYPGKCIGDGTLAYRSYFGIARKVAAEFPADTFYTYAPLASAQKYTTLEASPYPNTAELYEKDMTTVPAVLQSNCNCEFTAGQMDTLQSWKGKSFEKGAVYVNLLFNPAAGHAIDSAWVLRKPSGIELWMEGMKKKLK